MIPLVEAELVDQSVLPVVSNGQFILGVTS